MDEFVKTQEKFIKIVNNSKKVGKVPQAILIEGNNNLLLSKAVEYLKLSLLCDKIIPCFECLECQRIINKENADIIEFDLNEVTLKKDDVLQIQNRFSKTALEMSNKQIYVIKNIENASHITMNALLKFLEEPNDNVYAIFTSYNVDKVLETIKSRTIIFRLAQNSIEDIKKIYYENYQKSDVDFVALMTNDETFMKYVLSSDIYLLFKENINKILKGIFNGYFYILINEMLSEKEKDDLGIFFELFYVCLTNVKCLSGLKVDESVIEMIIDNKNYDKCLDVILTARLQLDSNMNKMLLIDKFSIEMEEAML